MSNQMPRRNLRIVKLIVLCVVGILPSALALFFYRQLRSLRTDRDSVTTPGKQGELWTCPMHLQYVKDRFGACPICGMDLVLQKSLN